MYKKLDLTDVTFLTLIRLDSIDRLENIIAITEFIVKSFETNILLLEVDKYDNRILKKALPKEVEISFIENHDPIFHRTHYLNKVVKMASTPIISLWDSDVLVDKKQIEDAVKLIRKKKADIVLPYNRKFLDTSMIIRNLYLKTQNLDVLRNNRRKMRELYAPDPVGGALFANKKAYINAGMENESFYGWGNHDGERINRWEILGYEIKRIDGPIYHLTHERGNNSIFHSTRQKEVKRVELQRLALMSKTEMIQEIKNWY